MVPVQQMRLRKELLKLFEIEKGKVFFESHQINLRDAIPGNTAQGKKDVAFKSFNKELTVFYRVG